MWASTSSLLAALYLFSLGHVGSSFIALSRSSSSSSSSSGGPFRQCMAADASDGSPAPPSIFDSIKAADMEGLKQYIEAGYECNVADALGTPAMNQAAAKGNVDMMKLMAAAGGRAEYASFHGGETPLHESSARGHLEAVKYLVNDMAVNVNAQNNMGDTPLNVACFWGHVEVAEVLLGAGADVQAVNVGGKCAGQEFDFILQVGNAEGAKRKDQILSMLETERRQRGLDPLGPVDGILPNMGDLEALP